MQVETYNANYTNPAGFENRPNRISDTLFFNF